MENILEETVENVLWVGHKFTKAGDMEVRPSLWPGSQGFAFGKVKLRMTTRHLSNDLE